MRFSYIIKVKGLCHAAKETSTSKLVVHFRGHRDPSLNYLSNSRCEILPRRSEDYALISNVRHSSNKGRYGKVLQSSKLLLVGSWRWYSFIGGMKQITKCQDGRFDNWANVWNLIRARACRMTNREKNTVYKASPKALPLKFAALADRIGQVEVRVLGLMLGGCFLFTDMPAPTAEQLHGKIVINSMNPQRLSFGAQAIAFICKTVETSALLFRAIYLLALFMPTLMLAPLADRLGGRLRIHWLQILLFTLENAGPAFIKWGQWAATRPDIFPHDVCKCLARLHMKAPTHTFQQTRKMFEKAFRTRLEDIFEEFSEEPVASGSIAQVHKAILKHKLINGYAGQVVAVKVRHPGISRIIQRDFVIIKWLAKISAVTPGLQHLQLDKTVQQFASFMTKQVDLTLEAAHLLRFIYNFRKSHNVSFPVPIYPWVHPGVLVEMDNFIHGDLHPGNIFVRFRDSRPNVVLLDAGMTAELNQRSRDVLIKLFEAVARKDGTNVAKWTLQFSEDQSCPDPEAFARDVNLKFKEYLSIRGTSKNTGECMTELFDQVRKHRVSIDGDVCTVMVTTLILEGWQRKLDPDLDIITIVGELLFKREWHVTYDYIICAIAAP